MFRLQLGIRSAYIPHDRGVRKRKQAIKFSVIVFNTFANKSIKQQKIWA